MKILLVEDEILARTATEKFLQRAGYDVVSATSPDEALQKASENPPELLICDWELRTEQDGVDVARELQRRAGVPVIFITGQSLRDLRAASEDLRVLGYFRKPVSLAQLSALLTSLTHG